MMWPFRKRGAKLAEEMRAYKPVIAKCPCGATYDVNGPRLNSEHVQHIRDSFK